MIWRIRTFAFMVVLLMAMPFALLADSTVQVKPTESLSMLREKLAS